MSSDHGTVHIFAVEDTKKNKQSRYYSVPIICTFYSHQGVPLFIVYRQSALLVALLPPSTYCTLFENLVKVWMFFCFCLFNQINSISNHYKLLYLLDESILCDVYYI